MTGAFDNRNIELRHLRHFIVAAEEEHFRRAAQRLNIAQPALSRQISDLEDRLGVQLFHRANHQVRLTEAGRALHDEARRLLRQTELAIDRVASVAQGRIGRLRIAFSASTVRHPIVPDLLMRFRSRNPDVQLAIVQMNSAFQLDALEAGEVDAAFGFHEPAERARFDSTTIGTDAVVLALPRDNPHAGRETLLLRDLQEEKFIWMRQEHNPLWHSRVDRACREGGLVPRIAQEVQLEDEEALLTFVARGMGVTFVYSSIQQWSRRDIHLREVSDLQLSFNLNLAWRQGNQSPTLAALITLAGEMAAQSVAPQH